MDLVGEFGFVADYLVGKIVVALGIEMVAVHSCFAVDTLGSGTLESFGFDCVVDVVEFARVAQKGEDAIDSHSSFFEGWADSCGMAVANIDSYC